MANEDKEGIKTDWKIPIIVVGSIVGLAIIIWFVVLISNSGTKDVINKNYQDNQVDRNSLDSQISGNSLPKKNCRQEQVPYEELETYYETVPYEKEVDLLYEAEHGDTIVSSDTGAFYGCGSLFNYVKCFRIMIYNIDTIGGTFQVICNMRTINNEFSQESSVYVQPGEYGEVMCEADVDTGVDVELSNFKIIPPTKEEIDYKDVERTRTVTKYRTEEVCD